MGLKEKLLNVMVECSHISRDAYNSEGNYPYVSAAKLNDVVNRALTANRIVTTAQSKLVDMKVADKNFLATVEVEITLYDVDSEESLTIRGLGSGIDAGDKSVAKAQTMAAKQAWIKSLLIADSSDEPDAVNGKIETLKKTQPFIKTTNNIQAPF